MSRQTWWGRLFARLTVGGRKPVSRRPVPVARLTLDRLPDRDSPSALDLAAVAPFAVPGASVPTAQSGSGCTQEARPTGGNRELLAAFVIHVRPGSDARTVPPTGGFTLTSNRLDGRRELPAINPRQPSAVGSHAIPDADRPPGSAPQRNTVAPPPPAAATAVPSNAVTPTTVGSVSTPAAFLPDTVSWQPVDRVPDGRLVPAQPVQTPSEVAGPRPGGMGAAPTPSAPPPNVVITPVPLVGIQPVRADTPAFRVHGGPTPVGPVRVSYTLHAHAATGTVSAGGSVTLPRGGGPVVLTPGPELVRGSPDVLTLTLPDQPGVRPARDPATLFLTPAHRVADSALFEAYRLGRSPEAFRVLAQRHAAVVTRACLRVVGNRADAEDVSQFVFLELSRFRSRFSGTLAAWLRVVARNAALAFLRAKRRRLRYELQSARPTAADPPPAGLDESLTAALHQLPPELGQAVRLRYLEGYTQHEAARIAGCPRGTLSRRAAQGIEALRGMLRDGPPAAG